MLDAELRRPKGKEGLLRVTQKIWLQGSVSRASKTLILLFSPEITKFWKYLFYSLLAAEFGSEAMQQLCLNFNSMSLKLWGKKVL